MALEYNKDYWQKSKTLTSWQLSTFKERKNAVILFNSAQKRISRKVPDAAAYGDLLSGKKAFADEVVRKKPKSKSDFDLTRNGAVLEVGDVDDVALVNQVLKEVNNQKQVEFLQLYYDCYMNNTNSDAQWRLGNILGSLKGRNLTDSAFGEIVHGSIPSRSNMSYTFPWNYVNEVGVAEKGIRTYSSLGFPPYKFGSSVNLGQSTNKMEKLIQQNSAKPTFDQDAFKLTREDFTFRDVGMKSLSDWINYLQYIAEGATGIVSTYLTEWDLSVYIQEGLMLPKVNGGPMDVYLNYRIKQDNPLADQGTQRYIDDRALSFNVCGSAVSKLFYDCTKNWRPSDFPLSAWWMPYLKDRDWKLAETEIGDFKIQYMSFYDDLVVSFPYASQTDLREIFKHQDYIGFIARAANTMDIPYWSAFYSSESDGTTNIDVKLRNMLTAVAGCDYGVATSTGKDLNYLKAVARKECILNGGYYGGPSTVDQNGGMYGRTMMDNLLNTESTDSAETMLSSFEQLAASPRQDDAVDPAKNPAKTSVNGNTKDSSVMSKLVGVNRFSPAIYGGPHGSDYSPYHLRDYFKSDSLVTAQVPKIYFANLTNEVKDDANPKYDYSPNKALSYLKEGSYSYYKKLVYCKTWIKKTFEGTVSFNRETLQFEARLPENYNGSPIIYDNNKITYKTKVYNTRKLLETLDYKWWQKSLVKNPTEYGTEVFIKIPVCEGKYWGFCEKTVKFYEMGDYPTAKWRITAHKFQSFSANVGKTDFLFGRLRGTKYGPLSQDTKDLAKGAGWILSFDDPSVEEAIKLNLIQYNKGVTNSPKWLYFIGCDDSSTRFTDGPSYMFKAPVYVRYYENVSESTKKFLQFTVAQGSSSTYVPYLYVDLAAATEYFDFKVPLVQPDVISSEFIPAHLASFGSTLAGSSPLQKVRPGISSTITAWKTIEREETSATTKVKKFLFGLFKKKKTTYSTETTSETVPLWSSTAQFGIEGVGILSGWQGVEPSDDHFETSYGTYNVHSVLSRCGGGPVLEDVPISELPLKSTVKANAISYKQSGAPQITYMSKTGQDALQRYSTAPIDDALKKAINQLCTSINFKFYDSETSAKMGLNIPVRNFLSYCCTELNYMRAARDVYNTLKWENIRKVLLNNVDACVLKASGLKKIQDGVFEKVQPDVKHALYNYWIEVAIDLFFDPSHFEEKSTRIADKFAYIISCLETTVSIVSPIIEKPAVDWTWGDWKKVMGQIYIQQELTEKNEVDEFFFAYLNILYMYRLFFIGKRFNKEDGTMWMMRQLESTIDLVHTNEEPAKSPAELNDDDKEVLNVVFYELQNSLEEKRIRVIKDDVEPLEVDKIARVYVKVEYATEADWKAWLTYKRAPNTVLKAREVIRLSIDGVVRYAFKPTDGLYRFSSKEWAKNLEDVEWNKLHPEEQERHVVEYIDCVFPIEWKPMKGKTPIRFNILGSVSTTGLLEYSRESIAPQDVVCLCEQGMDCWTIDIPASLQPSRELFYTKMTLSYIAEEDNALNDVYTVVLGPFANSISPIKSYDNQLLGNLQKTPSFVPGLPSV